MSKTQADENFLIVRLDGRDFHILTEAMGVERPFDLHFALSIVEATKTILQDSPRPAFAYTISDEVNFVFSDRSNQDSLNSMGSALTKRFSKAFHNAIRPYSGRKPSHFDWRVWGTDSSGILSYLAERQEWAYTNFLKAYAFWLKIASGLSPIQARESLSGFNSPNFLELMSQAELDPEKLPLWQRRGIIVCKRRSSFSPDQKPGDSCDLYVDLEVPLFKSSHGLSYIVNLLNDENTRLHGVAPEVDG